VWGGGEFATNVAAMLQRRLIEERPDAAPPFDGGAHVGLAEIEALLKGEVDETELTRWFFRFSLFYTQGANTAKWNQQIGGGPQFEALSPAMALFVLFKPLFDAELIQHKLVGASKPARVGTLCRISALLGRRDVNSAVQSARHAYHAVGVELADFESPFDLPNPDRLLASLSIPVRGAEVAERFYRWRSPGKFNQRKER
jgi:CRISPR-associated protein Csx17